MSSISLIVVVDLPEAADVAVVDDAEVMLAVGIVVFAEGVELAHLGEKRASALAGRASTPAVTTTTPPTKVRRKASLSWRTR